MKVEKVEVIKVVEEIIKSSFAPSLKDILDSDKSSRGKKQKEASAEYIKEVKQSEENPKKMIELKEILQLIMDATFINPYTDDTEEVKEQKIK